MYYILLYFRYKLFPSHVSNLNFSSFLNACFLCFFFILFLLSYRVSYNPCIIYFKKDISALGHPHYLQTAWGHLYCVLLPTPRFKAKIKHFKNCFL